MEDQPELELDRGYYFLLGILLHQASVAPDSPELSVEEILGWANGTGSVEDTLERVEILKKAGLVTVRENFTKRPASEAPNSFVELTAAGVAYTLNNAFGVFENLHGLTWDMPDEIGDSLFELLKLGKSGSDSEEEVYKARSNYRYLSAVPAADRAVDIRHNQKAYKELVDALSLIKNEFASDHNKRDLPVDNMEARLAEIEAFELLVHRGWMTGKSANNLMQTLSYIRTACIDVAAIATAASMAIAALKTIFGSA
ncbi:MAG: hypothetical protein KF899_16045 [Parvibaculum sp.]|nr:hypothetical protein [Parvibaculum sp.]